MIYQELGPFVLHAVVSHINYHYNKLIVGCLYILLETNWYIVIVSNIMMDILY